MCTNWITGITTRGELFLTDVRAWSRLKEKRLADVWASRFIEREVS
jgi:hypothetical protein